jgi:hypothetical protein
LWLLSNTSACLKRMLRHTALRFARVARPRGIRARRCAPTTHRWPPFQPCRGLATAGGEGDKKPAPEPSKWEKIRTLFREHGVAFAGVYTVAYTATFVPLMGALTVGGVDGPELVLWGAEQLRIPYDLTWIQDGPLSKDLINAFIAMELNGWIEFARLPVVLAATPRASAWLNARRGR